MKRISAYKRLQDLPEVFTTKALASRLGGDMRLTSVYIHRWRTEGLISSMGPRAGLHFNLARNPKAEEELRMEALAYLFPGAMIAGVSAVHAAGWTTQIPSETEIMVPMRRSFPSVDGFSIEGRGRDWLNEARRHIARPGPVPMVEPAFALADLWQTGSWRPDPDDLEWDIIDGAALKAAFQSLGNEVPDAWLPELEAEQMSLGF